MKPKLPLNLKAGPNKSPILNKRSKKRPPSLLTFLTLGCLTSTAVSQTSYTWTGTNSGDWADATNWDANGIPVDNLAGGDNNAGLSLPADGSNIIFDGGTNPLPTSNIPDLGGNVAPGDTPAIVVNQGGSIDFNLGGREGDVWSNTAGNRNVFTVGDGVGAAGEVTVNLSSNVANPILARHASDTTNNFQVNSDGILNFTSATIDFGWQAGNRHSKITIDGGQVNLSGVVDDLTTFSERVIEFTSIGGSFTALYGGDFADIAAVDGSLGIDFISPLPSGVALQATDNGTSFTVTSIVAQDPNYWTGTGGATWDETPSLNFTTNAEAAALVIDTFANAKAIQNRVNFADEYFDSGVGQAVTQSSVTIASGGVSTGSVDFTNNDVDYTFSGLDNNGISGSTTVSVIGTGNVNFNNLNTYSGATIVSADSILNIGDGTLDGSIANSPITNNGTLTFNNAGAVSHDSSLGGAGTLEKLGAGTLTLNGGSTLSGGTTVTSGTLVINGQAGSGSHTIASGAVLELFHDGATSVNYAGNTTVSGDGILRKTGSGETLWGATIAIFELSADALIDVQAGLLRGGSNNNEVWTNNFSDLNVETGATFRGAEANVRVDVLTGGGIILSGWDPSIGYEEFTIGVANGSGTFDGVIADVTTGNGRIANLTKVGTGTQTLTGINTYTGDTTIEDGVITLADGGELTLVPAANGINNVITGVASGSGTINLDGVLYLELGGTDTSPGNNWLIVDDSDLTVNYGSTFAIDGSAGPFTDNGGVWTLEENGNSWTFTESTGILELGGSIYTTWVASFGLTGADTLGTADPDSDSASNLYEFGIGTDPSVSDLGALSWDGVSATATAGCPVVATNGSAITAQFMRRKDHGSAGSIAYTWEFSSDLTDWESSDTSPAWLAAPTDLADDASGDYDLVEVPFPTALDNGQAPRFFRLTVTAL